MDASAAYVAAGRDETARRGLDDAVEWVEGDVVALATGLPPSDIITLDRVVCCYPACVPLLDAATGLARQIVAVSYPRDRGLVRAAMAVENAGRRLRGSTFVWCAAVFVKDPG